MTSNVIVAELIPFLLIEIYLSYELQIWMCVHLCTHSHTHYAKLESNVIIFIIHSVFG